MTQQRRGRAWPALAAIGIAAGAAVSGCASGDSSTEYQTSLSAVQSKQASAAANENFAADSVRTDQKINTVRGAERMTTYEAIEGNACPGSVLATRLKKIRDEKKIDSFAHAPNKKTEILGSFVESNPNHVIVIFRNTNPDAGQQQKPKAIVNRIKLGTNAGKLCVTEVERL